MASIDLENLSRYENMIGQLISDIENFLYIDIDKCVGILYIVLKI